jgi:hypothetical protein
MGVSSIALNPLTQNFCVARFANFALNHRQDCSPQIRPCENSASKVYCLQNSFLKADLTQFGIAQINLG